MKKLLVFTDLDGSLLDHDTYSWAKAEPALRVLKENDFPVVFTSSKTATEILDLKKQTENYYPFISENGAVAAIPKNYFDISVKTEDMRFESQLFGESYEEIKKVLSDLHSEFNFRGFSDMDADEVKEKTGLTYEQAVNAKQREASEPILWLDTKAAFDKFKVMLFANGLTSTAGGRFIHIMSNVSKGKTVDWLIQKYREAEPETKWYTVGIGDSFNDIQMLEIVDCPIFISNAKTRLPDLSGIKNLKRPQLAGPAGWNQAIQGLIKKFHEEFEL